MRNKNIVAVSIALLSLFYPFQADSISNDNNIRELVRFIVSKPMLTTNLSANEIPLSFYVGDAEDVALYFGDYVCTSNNGCSIVDRLFIKPFAILGQGLAPMNGSELEWIEAQNQLERTNMKYGTDIYHGAAWQIALALAAKNGYISQLRARTLVANQLETITEPVNRAFGPSFLYGGLKPIWDYQLAYTFRWLATNFYNKDPFFNGRYRNYLSRNFTLKEASRVDPQHLPPAFYSFVISWSDQKPLTGKNAWAQLIGPLQAEYIFTNGKVSAISPAVRNAMNVLTAFSLMQSGIGAFYLAPSGSWDAQTEIPPGAISLEDNFAALAGLQILKNILQKTVQTEEVKLALARINVMLNGGVTLNGIKTLGLLSFLYNGSFDNQNGIFYVYGSALTPSSTNDWRPFFLGQASFSAVSTNLWALSALGVETIDNWFGQGTSLKIWQNLRDNGGYFNNGQLWGLGYSLNNNLGSEPESIMSTANTAAAINALNSLIDFYGDSSEGSGLREDLVALQLNIQSMRNDLYLDAGFKDAVAREYFISVPSNLGQAYLYASKRLFIPLDWNANPIASLSANAWVLMNNFNFNPFQYRGKLAGENYPVPNSINILDNNPRLPDDGLPKAVALPFFTVDNLGAVWRLTLRYNLDGSQTNWLIALITDRRIGFATLPQGTQAISVSFENNNRVNTCTVNRAVDICLDPDCTTVKEINIYWSSGNLDSCNLSFQ